MLNEWHDASPGAAPAAAALATVLRTVTTVDVGCRKEGLFTKPVQVFSYRKDFSFLWESLDELVSPRGNSLDLVIVWDGVPEGDVSGTGSTANPPPTINVSDYVTMFDWIVGLCCAADKRGNSLPQLRVHVVDLNPPRHSKAFGVRMLPSLLSQLPWVRIYGPTTVGDLLTALINTKCDLSADNVDMIKRLWVNEFVQPEGLHKRHSIANLIGPRMLLRGMRIPQQVPDTMDAVAALEELMARLQLIPEKPGTLKTPWFTDWNAGDDRVRQFVLIDDMADLGWNAFLQHALGFPAQNPPLTVCMRPDHNGLGADKRKNILQLIIDENNGRLLVNQRIFLTDCKEGEVLFLDLRLFGMRAVVEELTFVSRLLDLAKTAPAGEFSSRDIRAVERYLDCKEPNEDYFVALTLLPRLIAIADPQLPIIVFSSTGQRVIMSAFDKYKNIITKFDKPRFFGDAPDAVVKDAAFRFKDAMVRAMRTLKGRRFCQRMIDDGPRSMPTAPTATAIPQNDERMARRQQLLEQNKYVEIYIDESFKNGARVGGLVAAYPDAAAASQFTQDLHAQCPKIVWGFDEHKCQLLTSQPLDKRPASDIASDIVRATLEQIESLANTKGIVLSAFLLEASQEQVALAQKTSAPSDFLYRELLRNAIECFLYLWPKAQQEGTAIGIHAATRVDKSPNDPLDPTWAEGWQEKFGCIKHRNRNNESCVTSLSHADVRPIVESVRAVRRRASPDLSSAKGLTLRYYERRGEGIDEWVPKPFKWDPVFPRQIHYVADWVAGYPDEVPCVWWTGGFRETADADFERLIQSSRLAEDSTRSIDALAEWARVRDQGNCSIAQWVKGCIKRSILPFIGNLNAADFDRLCDCTATIPPRKLVELS